MKTIYETMELAKKGNILTDGVRTWKVISSDGTKIGMPYKWSKKMGPKFELWQDSQSKVSFIPNLKLLL
jgi:hypothetical protein